MVLSGTYQGEAIFVQNPYNMSMQSYCSQEVYVNDRKLFDAPQISAFKIDLTHLMLNDLVVIRITYSNGCAPKIVNPHVIQTPKYFKFITTQTDQRHLSWMTAGEQQGGKFTVEQYNNDLDKWDEIASTPGKGGKLDNRYKLVLEHPYKNVNKYRVRYEANEGLLVVYSVELIYSRRAEDEEPIN